MPQFLIFAAVGAGLYAGYRLVKRVGEDVADAVRSAEHDLRQRAEARSGVKDMGKLTLDPKSGEYRPVTRD